MPRKASPQLRDLRDGSYKPVPRWVQELVDTVCDDAGVERARVSYKRPARSGTVRGLYYTFGQRIEIVHGRLAERGGDSRRFLRLVVLHELAHHLVPDGVHSPRFYAKTFELCKRYGIPMRWAIAEEKGYKPRASRSGYKLYRRQLRGE